MHQHCASHLDTRVLAICPLDIGAGGLLQDWVRCIVADHVVRLHQLLVAEEGVVTELKDDLEPLQGTELIISLAKCS